MIRAISYSEGAAMLRCQAAWDFQYGDRLAGSALKQKDTPELLQEGSAWGAAVAVLHETGDRPKAEMAMLESLARDANRQYDRGALDLDGVDKLYRRLVNLLEQYAGEAGRLPLECPEHEMLVRLPSRSGKGFSNRYRLHTFFDGLHTDEDGRTWIVEFKLRKRLSSLEQVANSRQIRYYAWAWFIETGQRVAGVIVDERLNEMPKPARWVQSKKKGVGKLVNDQEAKDGKWVEKWMVPSHAKDQLCTPQSYEEACLEVSEGPKADVLEALEARQWQARHRIFLTEAEVDEAGAELVSLAKQIQALDAHDVYPVRDVRQQNCGGCRFREICNHPEDADLVDVLFDRVPPKRDLPELETQQKEVSA